MFYRIDREEEIENNPNKQILKASTNFQPSADIINKFCEEKIRGVSRIKTFYNIALKRASLAVKCELIYVAVSSSD
jgi:hypothetical protein